MIVGSARFAGLDIVVTGALPVHPTPGMDGRRIVRHGLADILEWLGEEVGPKPGEPIHVIVSGRRLVMSAEAAARLRAQAEVDRDGRC